VPADKFPWRTAGEERAGEGEGEGDDTAAGDSHRRSGSSSSSSSSRRWRLVVLEANWANGKTIFNQLTAFRELRGLPPLPTVVLTDLKGEYWRFHEEGLSSVSTIEAIAHTARAAGLPPAEADALLQLFRLQKLRVLGRVQQGGKAPKAVSVSGEGLGSWAALTQPFHATAAAAVAADAATAATAATAARNSSSYPTQPMPGASPLPLYLPLPRDVSDPRYALSVDANDPAAAAAFFRQVRCARTSPPHTSPPPFTHPHACIRTYHTTCSTATWCCATSSTQSSAAAPATRCGQSRSAPTRGCAQPTAAPGGR
jgi:hypothetical protein